MSTKTGVIELVLESYSTIASPSGDVPFTDTSSIYALSPTPPANTITLVSVSCAINVSVNVSNSPAAIALFT